MNYDLIVIGDSHDGVERSLSAAAAGRQVVIVGGFVPLPSPDLMRLALLNLTGTRSVTMQAWRSEIHRLIQCQTMAASAELELAGVARIPGRARFVAANSVELTTGNVRRLICAPEIVVACGTRARQFCSFVGDARSVCNIESLLDRSEIPRSIVIVGAGRTGLAAAAMLAQLGVDVTVVDEQVGSLNLSEFFSESFQELHSLNIAFRLGDEVIGTELRADRQVAVRLASGKLLVAEAVLACIGQEGRTGGLNLETVGVGVDDRGRLWCDNEGRTWVPTIRALGDVIGFPRLSSQHDAAAQPESTDAATHYELQLSV